MSLLDKLRIGKKTSWKNRLLAGALTGLIGVLGSSFERTEVVPVRQIDPARIGEFQMERQSFRALRARYSDPSSLTIVNNVDPPRYGFSVTDSNFHVEYSYGGADIIIEKRPGRGGGAIMPSQSETDFAKLIDDGTKKTLIYRAADEGRSLFVPFNEERIVARIAHTDSFKGLLPEQLVCDGRFYISSVYKVGEEHHELESLAGFELFGMRSAVDLFRPTWRIQQEQSPHPIAFLPAFLFDKKVLPTYRTHIDEDWKEILAVVQPMVDARIEQIAELTGPEAYNDWWDDDLARPHHIPVKPSPPMAMIPTPIQIPTAPTKHEVIAFVDEERERRRKQQELEDLLECEMEKQSGDGEGPDVYHIPDILLTHPDVVRIYDAVKEAKDYGRFIARLDNTIGTVMMDEYFWRQVPDSFVMASIGPADSMYESVLINQALANGKNVAKYLPIDEDVRASSDAMKALGEDCVPVVGLEGYIHPEDLAIVHNEAGDIPIVFFAQDIINFTSKSQEQDFYSGVMGVLRPGDCFITSKPDAYGPAECALYSSSQAAGEVLMRMHKRDMEKWEFDGFKTMGGQIDGVYRCIEQDGKYEVDDEIHFLHSSRRSITELITDIPSYHANFKGHEVAVFK